jgi:hypothetical protein
VLVFGAAALRLNSWKQIMTAESELWCRPSGSHIREGAEAKPKRPASTCRGGQGCLPVRRKHADWVLELALMCVLVALLPRGGKRK